MADKYPKYMKAQAEAAGLYLAKIKYDLDDIILHTSTDQTDKSLLENS